MKTMCPPGYHNNGFAATHAHGHMIYGYIYIYILKMSSSVANENQYFSSMSSFNLKSFK